jgi:carboxyl-terminal processing protease
VGSKAQDMVNLFALGLTANRLISLLLTSTLLSACSINGDSDLAQLSPRDYFNKAVQTIQNRALKSPSVDWVSVKSKSIEMIVDAKTTMDTYPAINYVLSQLGDDHSFLKSRNGSATRAYRASVQPVLQKRVDSPIIINALDKKFGFVSVSGLGASSESKAAEDFARSLQHQISEIAQEKPAGWIVDLRGNTGGNMWPMIVGVGPLIGAGTLGFFVYPKTEVAWFYEHGQAGVINQKNGKHANFKLENGFEDLPNASVVVLVDNATASSGEALTISFKGRAQTRIMGKPTRGLSTNNESIKLADGATLFLTTSGEADRNHVLYDSGITPDDIIDQGEIALCAKNDPGMQAAINWLNAQVD